MCACRLLPVLHAGRPVGDLQRRKGGSKRAPAAQLGLHVRLQARRGVTRPEERSCGPETAALVVAWLVVAWLVVVVVRAYQAFAGGCPTLCCNMCTLVAPAATFGCVVCCVEMSAGEKSSQESARIALNLAGAPGLLMCACGATVAGERWSVGQLIERRGRRGCISVVFGKYGVHTP